MVRSPRMGRDSGVVFSPPPPLRFSLPAPPARDGRRTFSFTGAQSFWAEMKSEGCCWVRDSVWRKSGDARLRPSGERSSVEASPASEGRGLRGGRLAELGEVSSSTGWMSGAWRAFAKASRPSGSGNSSAILGMVEGSKASGGNP